MHGSDVVYLHAMPDADGQSQLRNLTIAMNIAMEHAGVPVHHPRKTLFHMTLARVRPSYPADVAVAALSRLFRGTGLQVTRTEPKRVESNRPCLDLI